MYDFYDYYGSPTPSTVNSISTTPILSISRIETPAIATSKGVGEIFQQTSTKHTIGPNLK
jgi:hypothetical protein